MIYKLLNLKIVIFILMLMVQCGQIQLEDVVITNSSRVWGPGLRPNSIIMPVRYFFVEIVNEKNKNVNRNIANQLTVRIEGKSPVNTNKQCRIWHTILDRKDGTFIVRYKLYEPCKSFQIWLQIDDKHIGDSPYMFEEIVFSDNCDCQKYSVSEFLSEWQCGDVPQQIKNDLEPFAQIDWNKSRKTVVKRYNKPQSVSLCRYSVKNNEIYRQCYGEHVGFKMFIDEILLNLIRKVKLPDLEIFVNLGDWPLVTRDKEKKWPIFSWCGSVDTFDIVMPTYDITESTLEMMGRVMLDMLSVQGNVNGMWNTRIPKAFWRGRDSNRHRLDLVDIARSNPDLFNVSLTNFFFFRNEEHKYGPKVAHTSFFNFFDYKYQIALDGTVAAYRFPYLMAGGSLIFKQDSKYYEHFYNDLVPNKHYIPIVRNLSDLKEKLLWAKENDHVAHKIAQKSTEFANMNLLPQNIYCYYIHLFNEYTKKLVGTVDISNMDKVESNTKCLCSEIHKDEL